MIIKIQGIDFTLRYTARGLFVYERITGEPFSPEKLLNEYTLMYSILLSNNRHFSMLFEEFIDACDNDPSLFLEFRKWLINELKLQVQFVQEDESDINESGVKKN